MINFIIGFVVGGAVVYFIMLSMRKAGDSKTIEKIVYVSEDEAKKKENLTKIELQLTGKDKITNNEVEKLLGVSDATATRYLDEFEKAGKVRQINAGADTYYQVVK